MGLLYNIVAPTGSTWKNKEGVEKPNTMMIGRVIETSGGGKMAIIDGLPFNAFAAGAPLVLYFNDPKPRGNDGDPPPSRASRPAAPAGDDDVPF